MAKKKIKGGRPTWAEVYRSACEDEQRLVVGHFYFVKMTPKMYQYGAEELNRKRKYLGMRHGKHIFGGAIHQGVISVAPSQLLKRVTFKEEESR